MELLLLLLTSALIIALALRLWQPVRWLTLSLAACLCSVAAGVFIVGGSHAYLLTSALAGVALSAASLAIALHALLWRRPGTAPAGVAWAWAALVAIAAIAGFGVHRATGTFPWIEQPRELPRFVERILEASGGRCARLGFREAAWPLAVGAFLALQKEGSESYSGDELTRIVGRRYRRPSANCVEVVFVPRSLSPDLWRCEGAHLIARARKFLLAECSGAGE